MFSQFKHHPVFRNVVSLYGIQVAGYVLPFITFPYLARVLGAAKFGRVQWASAFMGYFLVITEYGFSLSATRDVSVNRDKPDALCRIYTTAMVTRLLLMLASLALMTVVVLAAPRLRDDWALFYISFLVVVGSALFPQFLFQGLEKMEYITIREVSARFIGLMTVFFLVRTESDYLWAAAIMSGSSAIAGAIGLMYVRRLTGVRFTRTSIPLVRHALTDGWHLFVSTAAIKLYTSSNIFILGWIANDKELGYFMAASKLIEAVKGLVSPLSTAIYPHVSWKANQSRASAVAFIERNLFRLTAPFAVFSLGLFIAAPIGIHIVYGNKFNEAIRLLRIMSPIPFIVAFGTSFATYYMLGLGYKKEWSTMIIMGGVLNFIVLLPLLAVCKPTTAVAVTSMTVESFVLLWSYMFYRGKQK